MSHGPVLTVPALDDLDDLDVRIGASKIDCVVCNRKILPNMMGTVLIPTRDPVCTNGCRTMYELNPLVYEKSGNGCITGSQIMGWDDPPEGDYK